jgi:hypothetical protein
MKPKDLEKVIFDEIGSYAYTLKKLDNPHPIMNAHGLIYIDGAYYKKVSVNRKELKESKYWHPAN